MKTLGWGLLALFIVAFTARAQAKATDYCTPVGKLTKRLSSCTDNEILFGDAAVACVNKFQKDADRTANELQNQILASGKAAGDKQSQQSLFENTEKDYLATQLRLGALILSGKRALQQVAEYRANLAMPEDFESAENMGFTTEGFLKSIPCFEDNRQLMVDVGKDLMKKINELEQARDLAGAQAKATASARSGLGETGTIPPAIVTGGQHAKGEGIHKGAPQNNGASDITGTSRKPAQLNP